MLKKNINFDHLAKKHYLHPPLKRYHGENLVFFQKTPQGNHQETLYTKDKAPISTPSYIYPGMNKHQFYPFITKH